MGHGVAVKISYKILATILVLLAWIANHNHFQLTSILLSIAVLIIIFLPTKN
jgi:hypothetical protein